MIKIKQLLIAILLIFCLSIFYFCFNYYREFRKFATENVLQQLTFESTFVKSQIQNLVSTATDHLIYMTMIDKHDQLMRRLYDGKHRKLDPADIRTMSGDFDMVKEKNPIISDIFLVDVDGALIAASSGFDDAVLSENNLEENLYGSIAAAVRNDPEQLKGNAAIFNGRKGRKSNYAVYAYPVLSEAAVEKPVSSRDQASGKKERTRIQPESAEVAFVSGEKVLRGYIAMVIPFDNLLESVRSQYHNSEFDISTKQQVEPQYYISVTETVKFNNVLSDNKIILYVSILKRVDEIESRILDTILKQIENNILISIIIGLSVIACFILITHSFGILSDFINEIRHKTVIGKEKFLIYEFNETSKQLLRMKKDIDSKVDTIKQTNLELKQSNLEIEKANNQLANINKRLEEQVQERTESLQQALNLSKKCNEISSTIISQRSVLQDDFTARQVFDAFVSTLNQFNLKKDFLFEYKIENERKLRFCNIDGEIPELDDNIKIDTYLNRNGFYIFPLNIKEGVGRLVIHSPMESIEPSILSNVSIYCRDVSIYLDNRVLRNRLSYWARTDGLTKLGNRAAYEQAMAFYETSLDNEIGLFLIDVNGLKEMNDKMGHAAGDALLKTVAERLKMVFAKRSASLYRIGGDEFIAILQQDELDNGTAILEELIAAQDDPVAMMNKRSSGIVATFAVGFADSRKVPFEMLYKHADAEMYARKEAYYKMRQEKFGEIRKPRH